MSTRLEICKSYKPIRQYHKFWLNFIHDKENGTSLRLNEWKAKHCFNNFPDGRWFVEFETEQDMVLFLLRWS